MSQELLDQQTKRDHPMGEGQVDQSEARFQEQITTHKDQLESQDQDKEQMPEQVVASTSSKEVHKDHQIK